MPYVVAAFYKFVALPDFRDLHGPLRGIAEALELSGTVLLADEGINATVAGPRDAIDRFLGTLRDGSLFGGRLADLDVRLSGSAEKPFGKLKVRLKKEIVTLGDPRADPTARTGARVAPTDWNALIGRPDVVAVDVRNAFEVAMGSFQDAIDPGTKRFSEFKRFAATSLAGSKDRTIALFCTGGIRCEKASAHLIANGFADVRQLQGGILNYLEQVDPVDSRWRGECFVFDERVALGPRLVERTGEGSR